MPFPLQESLRLVGELRAENGATVAHLNDQELADIVYQQTKDERLAPAARSNALMRGVSNVGQKFSELGQSAEDAIVSPGASFPRRVAGRVANNLVGSIPELGASVASMSMGGVPRVLAALGGGGFSYGRTKAETGDEKAALGAGAGFLTSLAGGVVGGRLAERAIGPAAGALTKAVGGTVGAAVGSAPGDALEIGTSPGGFEEFLADPVNLPAYVVGQGVGDAGTYLADKVTRLRKQTVESKKAATPDLDSQEQLSDADRLVQINKKPIAERTELEVEEARQIARKLAAQDESVLAKKLSGKSVAPTDLSGMQETPATLKSQLFLLNAQKKAVVELPAGQDAPDMIEVMQGYKSHDSTVNGNTYFYDERKTSPEQIDNAIKTNSLGYLLGYGVPSVPTNPSGELAVLRSKSGLEKTAVILSAESKDTVLKSLGEMALGDDVVSIETAQQVAEWRQRNKGLVKLYSIAGDSTPQNDISFTNHVLDMFQSSTQVKQHGAKFKGPKFQLDEQGQLGGKGLLRAIEEWAPGELWEHYKSKGIETLLSVNKVPAQQFSKWLRENTPEVEVKKLIPHDYGNQTDREVFQHQLETLGYEIKFDPAEERDFLYNRGELVDTETLPLEHNRLWNNYNLKGQGARSDAATGRYGVEPKELKDMPGAVDILVRVPFEYETDGVNVDGDPLFKGPHFGESDTNVLASIRGYMETLPTGEKVFHVFELQSDWGQTVRKNQEKSDYMAQEGWRTEGERTQFKEERVDKLQHPLLAHYETLALKTAIQHARAEGATKIAISDAETAMMTEGHDRYLDQGYRRVENTKTAREILTKEGYDVKESDDLSAMDLSNEIVNKLRDAGVKVDVENKIQQEPGMRAAYDERLPAIMKRLTGDKGSRAEFGTHKVIGESDGEMPSRPIKGSPVFNNKTSITARLYDITNPRPEVKRLFSIFDAERQASLESDLKLDLDKLDTGLRDGAELTPERLLDRSIQGDKRVERDALINFLAAIRGTRGALREGTFLSDKAFASIDLETHDIKFNKDVTLRVNEAFSKLAHELTHGAINELSPPQYQALKQVVNDMGQPARMAILTDLKKQLGLGNKFSPDYLSGARFDEADQYYADRVAHEFAGGLMEAAAQAHFNKSSATNEWMKWLPAPVQKLLTNLVAKIKRLFSEDMPSISAMLAPSQRDRLNFIVNQLQKNVISAEQANLRALLNLDKTSRFDESRFLDQLVDNREDFKDFPAGGSGALYSFAGDVYRSGRDAIKSRFENLFLPALWRARNKPETSGHFFALHNFRPNNKADEHGYLSFLGQVPDGSMSREQAIERWANFFDKTVMETGAKGAKFRDTFAKIQEENQNRREASPVDLTDADLVSPSEMETKYGLSKEEAEYARRLVKLPSLVANESARKAKLVDNVNLTRMFYAANKQQDIEGVRGKVDRMNRITDDAGAKRFEIESLRSRLDKLRKSEESDLEQQAEVQQELMALEAQEGQFKVLLDHTIRQEFAGAIQFRDMDDPFIGRMSEFMVKLAALRAKQRYITGSAGWASMSRRGRWRLRVWDTADLGDEIVNARVKEYRGFQTEAELNQYVKDNGFTEQQIEKMDMNDIKQRARAFTPDKLKLVRDQAKAQLDEVLREIQSKSSGLDPQMTDMLSKIVSDIQTSFQPLEQELKDVISVKGDKFGERRHNVAGYNINDFLPNTFEYMQYKTVAGNRALAAAESTLQISRRELDDQPELRERMFKEQNYVLSNQTEYNNAKKVIFYYYLGANFRHIIQNSVQIPLNGISQMVAEGSGLKSYAHFTKAAKLAFEYNRTGSTGDKEIDVLLKQADKDGVSFSTAIEAPLHESQELQNVLDSINAQADGKVGFGQKVKFAGTRMVKNFEKFLQATSVAAEAANRKTTFIASVLAERAKGVSDTRALYDKASHFTNFVNFVGDKPNRPGFMILAGGTPFHGPLGLMTTLQSFTLNHIGQLYSFYEKGFHQGSAQDKKALAVGVAHLLAFAGSLGFIGAATAEQLFEEVTGISLKTAVREGLVESFGDDVGDSVADTVLEGFPALLGVNVSNSIGLGNPLIRYQAGSPIAAEQFGGAGAGLLGRVATGVGQVTADPFNPQAWWAATRSASPSFLGNAIKGYELMNHGSTLDKNQQPVSDPLDTAGSLAQLAGFVPQEVAKQREFNSRVYRQTKKSAEDYERNVLRISQLIDDYQRGGNEESLLRANEMFAKYNESTGGVQDRDSMIDSITDQLAQNRGKVTKAASLKESPARQKLEKAFPSVTPRYSSSFDALLDQLEVAQLLGQDDVLARSLRSLTSSAQSKVLTDMLVEAGLRPEEVGQILEPRRLERQTPLNRGTL